MRTYFVAPGRLAALLTVGALLPSGLLVSMGAMATPETTSSPNFPARKIVRYADRLLTRYDTDGNGLLTAPEWAAMQGQPTTIDRNQDGQITAAEITQHITEYAQYRKLGQATLKAAAPAPPHQLPNHLQESPTTNDPGTGNQASSTATTSGLPTARNTRFHTSPPPGMGQLPAWFAQRDQNGDGQLSLAEFAPTRSRESVQTFQRLDRNHDGLLTPEESISKPATSQANKNPPAQTVPESQ